MQMPSVRARSAYELQVTVDGAKQDGEETSERGCPAYDEMRLALSEFQLARHEAVQRAQAVYHEEVQGSAPTCRVLQLLQRFRDPPNQSDEELLQQLEYNLCYFMERSQALISAPTIEAFEGKLHSEKDIRKTIEELRDCVEYLQPRVKASAAAHQALDEALQPAGQSSTLVTSHVCDEE